MPWKNTLGTRPSTFRTMYSRQSSTWVSERCSFEITRPGASSVSRYPPERLCSTTISLRYCRYTIHDIPTICLRAKRLTHVRSLQRVAFPKVIQRNVQDARSRQSAIYAITAAETSCGLISSCVPSILLKLLLNQLSKRYSLCLTHVDGDLPVEGVDGAVYWRPPQGNCSTCH